MRAAEFPEGKGWLSKMKHIRSPGLTRSTMTEGAPHAEGWLRLKAGALPSPLTPSFASSP
jgi:hypothetical protein